jgi:hypothetical protein
MLRVLFALVVIALFLFPATGRAAGAKKQPVVAEAPSGKVKISSTEAPVGITLGFAFETLNFKQSDSTVETGPAFQVLGHKSFELQKLWSLSLDPGIQRATWGGTIGDSITSEQTTTNLDLDAAIFYQIMDFLGIGPAFQYLYGISGIATSEFSGPNAGLLAGSKVTASMDSFYRFGYGAGLHWRKSLHSHFGADYFQYFGTMAFKVAGVEKVSTDFTGNSYRVFYSFLF